MDNQQNLEPLHVQWLEMVMLISEQNVFERQLFLDV